MHLYLGAVQRSCLNFKIQNSPFSANISIRKSFITDKKGNAIVPPEHVHLDQGHLQAENNYLINKVFKAERELNSIRCEHVNLVEDCEQIYKVKSDLENKIVDYESKLLSAE